MIVEFKKYDEFGNIVEGDNFHCIVFYIKKKEIPHKDAILFEAVKVENIPGIVAKYLIDEIEGGYGDPEEIKNVEELKKFGVPDDIIDAIEETLKKYGINWLFRVREANK
ncbi:hypothetical protein Metvu_1086 [Methanocaldococcus vulcanius M7]|uniref:Uncharacterized protein n=1 Tax=Methanocaldococcus vulcanius (strain ATCC 700851 / DSM 12094 / M7) TaxID=579137 RepID=C9RH92_METVM|nr:hypothetical protein [Methanocaldococcus vulcanius]ACX72944.1 hypothetical protein Metvu_1086 [Methanocaldococcus vulcanius M7]